jgi:hypothetical protein
MVEGERENKEKRKHGGRRESRKEEACWKERVRRTKGRESTLKGETEKVEGK